MINKMTKENTAYGLVAFIAWVSLLSALCFITGYMFATTSSVWMDFYYVCIDCILIREMYCSASEL